MMKYKYLLHVDILNSNIFKNMSSGPNGTQSAMLDEDEPKICNYTGQLIVEK